MRTRDDVYANSCDYSGWAGQGLEAGPIDGGTAAASAVAQTGEPHRWARQNRFILCMDDSDGWARSSAAAAAVHGRVPADNLFHLNRRAENAGTPLGTELTTAGLGGLTLRDRLNIHGHGNHAQVFSGDAAFSAEQLAEKLVSCGLKEVGVLKFQSCDVGRGEYLKELRDELARRGVAVGYLAGYTGLYCDSRIPFHLCGIRGFVDPCIAPVVLKHGIIPARARKATTVVRGNADVRFPHTLYDSPLQT